VEEQTPVQNQPRVNVRMTAQWKPVATRAAVKITAPVEENKKTNFMAGAVIPPATSKIPKP